MLQRIRKHVALSSCSVKQIADYEDISLQTSYKIYNKICDGLKDEEIINKTGRPKTEKLAIQNQVSQILLRDSSFTQSEISAALHETGTVLSQSTVSRILKDMGYTRKRLVIIPEERNAPKNIDARQIYAREIQFVADTNLVFLDETGMNLHQTRNYGYAPKNMKAYKVVKANRGTNISCMVAIKKTGVLDYTIKDGAFCGNSFISFIQEKLVQHFQNNPNDILIMDNCRFHHRKDVIDLLTTNNILHRFLPPYSPQLNPIEEYFSTLKSDLASIHPSTKDRNELKSRINAKLNNERRNFNGWFTHMRTYVEKALARQEFI